MLRLGLENCRTQAWCLPERGAVGKGSPCRFITYEQMTKYEVFPFLELIRVLFRSGILAAIAIPKFANTKGKAYIASMKSDLRNLVTAEEEIGRASCRERG